MLKRYGSFFLLALALGIAPGPDILFVFAQSLTHGWRAGALVTCGLSTGLLVHISCAAFGLAALLRRCPRAFTAVTWFGAAYLAWLGVGAWRSAGLVTVGVEGGSGPSAEALSDGALYVRGIVMNLLNPKVMLFFLALMPRFVDPKRAVAGQFLALGLVFIVATQIVFNLVAAGGGAISGLVSAEPESVALLERFSALVMFALAGWVAWTNLASSRAH